jgi:hypothetical protein
VQIKGEPEDKEQQKMKNAIDEKRQKAEQNKRQTHGQKDLTECGTQNVREYWPTYYFHESSEYEP